MSAILAALWRRPMGRAGAAVILVLAVLALFAPLIAPDDPNGIDVMHRFAAPSWRHLMGTDQLGRDFFSRFVFGARLALGVAAAVIALALSAGGALGLLAGFAPARVERLVLILFDVVAAFPSTILALAAAAALGSSLGTVILILALTLTPHFGRVARAQALTLRSLPLIEAERALGASRARILFRHVLPAMLPPLIVLASMDVPVVITIEAGLSFLGVGVRPPLASWGALLFDGYDYLDRSIWMALFSCLALTGATLGFTLFGEALRAAVDPRMRVGP
jgi:peptide/nickel transport system permease protein